MVPKAGLEPARYRYQWILSPPRLPIPSLRRIWNYSTIKNSLQGKRVMEERLLTDRAAKGDESAFRALLERYKNRIYALAYRFSGNHEDAEDISQEVVIKIYRYLPGFDNRSLFSTWVYSITKNKYPFVKK